MWIFYVFIGILAVLSLLFVRVKIAVCISKNGFIAVKWLFINVKIHIIRHRPGISICIRLGRKERQIPIKISGKREKTAEKRKNRVGRLVSAGLCALRLQNLDITVEAGDAAATAMCTGYAWMMINCVFAVYLKQCGGATVDVRSEFNGVEKFELFCILSVRPAQIIVEYFKKRGRNNAPYREFVADNHERA